MSDGTDAWLVPIDELPGLELQGLWMRHSYGDDWMVSGVYLVGPGHSDFTDWRERHRAEMRLDLSDTAAIDRCLRWLALRMGAGLGFGAPSWAWVPSWCAGGGRWELTGAITVALGARPWVEVSGRTWAGGWRVVEGLPEPATHEATREEQLGAFVHALRWSGRNS